MSHHIVEDSRYFLPKLKFRSRRYGPLPELEVAWVAWGNDGILPDGGPCSFKGPSINLPEVPPCLAPPLKDSVRTRDLMLELAEFALSLRYAQYLWDGNHRTCCLLIYELLADLGFECHADPLDLYVLLSNGGNIRSKPFEVPAMRAKRLAKLLRRTSILRSSITDSLRKEKAFNCKSIWKWSSFFEELSNVRANTRAGCLKLREVKRRSQKRYNQHIRLLRERAEFSASITLVPSSSMQTS